MPTTSTVRWFAVSAILVLAPASMARAQGIFAAPTPSAGLPASMRSANTPVFAAEREAAARATAGDRDRAIGEGEPSSLGSDPTAVDTAVDEGDEVGDVGSWLDNVPSVRLQPRLSYRYQYGDGIPAAPGQQQKTALQEITPGILIVAGSHWTFDYAPTWAFYSDDAFEDSLDHRAVLTGGGTHVDWTWGFFQSFGIDHDVLLETAAQTTSETWDTELRLALQLNSKMMIDSSTRQNLRYVETYADTKEWSNLTWLHYSANPRLNTGFGLGGGYLEMDGPDVYYFQALGRVSWRPTNRLALSVNAGADRRFSYSDRVPIRTAPIYGASLSYQPFPHTNISVNGNRAMRPSYNASELVDSIDWGTSLSQRLFGRYTAAFGYSRGRSDYVATTVDADPNRSDDFTSIDASLSTNIRENGTISAFYRDTKNESSSGGYSTTSTQVGFELGFRF